MYSRKIISLLVGLLFLLIGHGDGFAQSKAGLPPLIGVSQLSSMMGDADLVILDVRTFSKYEKSHIPGAVQAFGPWLTMNKEFVGFMMPEVQALTRMLRGYGIRNSSKVVLYDAGMTPQDTAKSARALWTLHVLGHEAVSILDGGFAAWTQEEKEVSDQFTIPGSGEFTPTLDRSKVSDLDQVRRAMVDRGAYLVDARIPAEYFGHEKKAHIKRFGHLYGALSWPASYLTTGGIEFSPSLMRPVNELREMASGVGLSADRSVPVIVYSNHGLQAALVYFVLHDLLGYEKVSLYDGGVLEAASMDGVKMWRYGMNYGINGCAGK